MNLKLTQFIALLIGILLLAGCAKELTTEEIQSKLLQANSNINSYSMDIKMGADMVFKSADQKMSIKMDVNSKGEIDRTNKKMIMKGTTKSSMAGMEQSADTETYILDKYIYTKATDSWTKSKLDESVWTQQDQIGQVIELAKSGSVQRLEDEKIDKTSYYVIKLNPDLKKVVELSLKEQQQAGLFGPDMKPEDVFKGYSLIIWVNKETFVIEKSKTDMKMFMTPESMGIVDTQGAGEINMDLNIETKISNINKEVVVTLPEDAKGAIDVSQQAP